MSLIIQYSANSIEDLKTIQNYIAYELLSPAYARGQVDRILKAVRSLSDMPLRHPIYDKEPWKTRNIRYLPIDNYIIFYLPNEEAEIVNIVRIIYGARDMKGRLLE